MRILLRLTITTQKARLYKANTNRPIKRRAITKCLLNTSFIHKSFLSNKKSPLLDLIFNKKLQIRQASHF